MTITHRLVVDLADIQALRIVCVTCKAALSLALTETVHVPTGCPNCGADWDQAHYGTQARNVEHLVRALKAPASTAMFLVQLELPADDA